MIDNTKLYINKNVYIEMVGSFPDNIFERYFKLSFVPFYTFL